MKRFCQSEKSLTSDFQRASLKLTWQRLCRITNELTDLLKNCYSSLNRELRWLWNSVYVNINFSRSISLIRERERERERESWFFCYRLLLIFFWSFLFLWVSAKGCFILLWPSLCLPLTILKHFRNAPLTKLFVPSLIIIIFTW